MIKIKKINICIIENQFFLLLFEKNDCKRFFLFELRKSYLE